MSSDVQRVEREDLVMFINACFACTGQAEFYGDAQGQGLSIDFLHEYTAGNYRRLYARTLAAGINHFNKALAIAQLLSSGAPAEAAARDEEGRLIRAAMEALPPQRALKLLRGLREKGVNNRRARAVAREYLLGRRDLAFQAVKYRRLLKAVVAHAHVKLPGEVGDFLFGDRHRRAPFETPIFEAFRRAPFDESALAELPMTVAEGFAQARGIPRGRFLKLVEESMSAGERLRVQRMASENRGAEVAVDLGRVPLTRLALYILSMDKDTRHDQREALGAAMAQAARRTLSRSPLRLGRVAAVLDRSFSSAGTGSRRRRPLAVAMAASALLRAASDQYRACWTARTEDELMLSPYGQTNLADPLVDALCWAPDTIVIVSDGFENDPPGASAEVVRIFRKRFDPDRRVSIIHMNPVFDAERFEPRRLGPGIPTTGLRDAEDLPTMLGFARFAEGTAPLSELEDYLQRRATKMIGARVAP